MSQSNKPRGYAALYDVQERKKREREESATPHADSTIVNPAIVESATIEDYQPQPTQTATIETTAIVKTAIVPEAFTRIPNGILDRVLPTLKPSDQVVLLRLYRLSRGFGKEECTVGYETLGKGCNMSVRQAQICIERLLLTGWIERVGLEQGGPSKQSRGSVYRVNLPAAATKVNSTIVDSAIVKTASYKDKDINERLKKGARARDFSKCPDCEGKGFWYPEGFERGVAKCKHKRMA